jgi:hypothetical protein
MGSFQGITGTKPVFMQIDTTKPKIVGLQLTQAAITVNVENRTPLIQC